MFGTNFSGNYYGNYSYGNLPPNSMGCFNYYNQPQPQQNPNINFQATSVPQTASKFVISPVASIDEAKSIQTPMDGSIMYLVNNSAGEIYSKTLASNGGVNFQVYKKESTKPVEESNTELLALQKRVEELEKLVKQPSNNATKKVKGGSDE